MPSCTDPAEVRVEVGALFEPVSERRSIGLVLRGKPGLGLPIGSPVLTTEATRARRVRSARSLPPSAGFGHDATYPITRLARRGGHAVIAPSSKLMEIRVLLCSMSHHLEVPMEPFSAFEPYAGGTPPEVFVGHLLVATPRLVDANFARRVVLVLDHGDHGALGVAIDRPGGVAVGELLPQWHALASPPAELFTGGPVARNALIGLVRLRSREVMADGILELLGWRLLVDAERPVGTVDLGADPLLLSDSAVGVRLFSGYAGWDSGQLEEEIEEGSWYVVPCEARDPISADPEGLWRRVLRRQGGALAVVAGFPVDPTMN